MPVWWSAACASRFGVQVDFKDVRSQIGKGGDQLTPVFLTLEQLAAQGKQLEEYRANLSKEKHLPQVRAFPQVRELFLRIHAGCIAIFRDPADLLTRYPLSPLAT